MEDLAVLEAEQARRGYRVRFEKVTEGTLPPEGESGCATLDEARALLERVQKVAAVGGIRNAHIVSPDGLPEADGVPEPAPPVGPAPPLGQADDAVSEAMAEPIPITGPLRLSRERVSELGAAVARLNSLPRVPSERLQALHQDAEEGGEPA